VRIKILATDKDHYKIGHTLLIKNFGTLKNYNWFSKIKSFPLLEEYFFGILAKIGLVLGEVLPKIHYIKEDIFKF
jgi:hypothetical protein